ncbi:hypothetical protein OQA88_7284 [Cercophora sp. LCS_1]
MDHQQPRAGSSRDNELSNPWILIQDHQEPQLKEMASAKEKDEGVNYVVYVKLPFNRRDFVDPPPVQWDERKSEVLWAHISGSQDEIRWEELAAHFNVTVQFLVQMAAFLTERHASQLRAQMRKIATVHGPSSNAPSPVPGTEPTGYPVFPTAEAIRRAGSATGRAPSALSARKDSPLPRNEPAFAGPAGPSVAKTGIPVRPQVSRNSSAGTTVPTTKTGQATTAQRRRLPSLGISTAQATAYDKKEDREPPSSSPVRSTSPSSDSDESSPVQSRIIRRPPRFKPAKGPNGDDDDEAEPAFLPFQPQRGSAFSSAGSGQDMGATVRGRDIRDFARRLPLRDSSKDQSQTSDSSTSSAAMVPRRLVGGGPLSPRRAAELAGRSPSGKGKGVSREGSDGTPSMGSSFSDLDDASVTQSALEEALASRMQDGTIGSRMSTIGQAIRSRYLPKGNGNKPREG